MRRGEADAFPPPCCRRLLPLARAWTSASFPNHLLPFPQPGPLSGDPLPPPLCPGQSSTAVSRMVVWAWAGCAHSPDSCPVPALLRSPSGVPFLQLPSSEVLGGLPTQLLLALPRPSPPVPECIPSYLGQARRTVHRNLPQAARAAGSGPGGWRCPLVSGLLGFPSLRAGYQATALGGLALAGAGTGVCCC